LSAIVTDNPVYFDTFGNNGWNMNIENATHQTPGWFSEASIQRILYDLYDDNRENHDQLSLGFKPIYETLIGGQKSTSTFTSIFSFITELKKITPSNTDKIDEIVASEDISTIENSYGSDRTSNVIGGILPLYQELTIDKTLTNVCTLNRYGIYNKLGNHKYIYFTVEEDNTYPILIQQSDGQDSDPDFSLFKVSPFEDISIQDTDSAGVESISLALSRGNYILDLVDSSYQEKSCFNISIGDVSEVDSSDNNSNQNSNNNEGSHSSTVGFTLSKNIFLTILLLFIVLFVPVFFIRKELKV